MRFKLYSMVAVLTAYGAVGNDAHAVYDTSTSPGQSVLSGIVDMNQQATMNSAIKNGFINVGTHSKIRIFEMIGEGSDLQNYGGPGSPQTASLFRYGATGMTAQKDDPRFSVWGQYAYTRFDEDQRAIDSDGMTHAFAFGSDYRWNNWFMTGLSFAYTRSDVDTTFNRGTLKSNGYNFAPYAVVSLIPNKLFLDVSAGYGFGDSKSTRTNGAITGSTDKSNYFVSGGLNMVLTANRWFAQPSAGILWSRSQWDAYRESNGTAVPRVVNHFGRMHVGSDVGYAFNSWQPFVGAKYLYDYKFEHAKDRNGVLIATAHRNAAELSMGTSVSLTNRLSGTLKGSTEAFRKDNSTYSFSGSLRYAF